MGAQSGLGFLMMVARRTLNTNTILLGMIIVGIESYVFDALLRAVGRYLTRWSESSLESAPVSI
jgi:ABC-type nitrate/sulfonate/bicarbonate transport system permease component